MAANFLRGATSPAAVSPSAKTRSGHRQTFNMCGYAAPRLEKVRVGLVGVGSRGTGAVQRLRVIEGVEIKALCDLDPAQITEGLRRLKGTPHEPATYSGREDAWKEMCSRDDLDVIYNCTPWHLHAPISIFVHGGAWRRGSAKDFAFQAEMFVRAGAQLVVLDINDVD